MATHAADAPLPSRWAGLDRSAPVWIGAALALAVLMLVPISWIAYVSATANGTPTFEYYRKVFTDSSLARAVEHATHEARPYLEGLRGEGRCDRHRGGAAYDAHQ